MLLKGPWAELMVILDPSLYRKYVIYEKYGVTILYLNMDKLLYGLLKSDIMFYKKLRGEIQSIGSEINLYDPFVSNKNINITQMTITWHVDELKVSNNDDFEITKTGKVYTEKI